MGTISWANRGIKLFPPNMVEGTNVDDHSKTSCQSITMFAIM
jgi:hypothetical protein